MVGFFTVVVVWFDEAACRGSATVLWFPDWGEAVPVEALELCRGCPVRWECLDASMWPRLEQGIWGGLGESARRRVRRTGWRVNEPGESLVRRSNPPGS